MPQLLQCGFIASAPFPGDSKDISSSSLVPVSGDALTRPFPGGWGFGLAATPTGELRAWGVNQPTLLAKKSGPGDEEVDPCCSTAIVAQGVASAAAGFDHCLLVDGEGKIFGFGPHTPIPAGTVGLFLAAIPLRLAVVRVAAGEHHSLALTAGGAVYAWGANREGQVGDGSGCDAGAPVAVLGPGCSTRDASLLQPVSAIACGARHSAALTAAGQCFAWGWSLHGQCGSGRSIPAVTSPALVSALGPLRCTSLAAGMGHTVVATDQGDVYAWGLNQDGQLGDGSDLTALEPKLVEAAALEGESATKVAAGARHTLVLCASGKAYAFGHGKFGQLGSGSFSGSSTPVAMAAPGKVVDLEAGWWHSLALLE